MIAKNLFGALVGHEIEEQIHSDERGEIWVEVRLGGRTSVRFVTYRNGVKKYHGLLEGAVAEIERLDRAPLSPTPKGDENE